MMKHEIIKIILNIILPKEDIIAFLEVLTDSDKYVNEEFKKKDKDYDRLHKSISRNFRIKQYFL